MAEAWHDRVQRHCGIGTGSHEPRGCPHYWRKGSPGQHSPHVGTSERYFPTTYRRIPKKKIIHPIAGTIAMLCIGSFWLSTLVSELFFSQGAVVLVKHTILQAMWIMIPAMAATAGSGFVLAGDRKGNLLAGKKKRMQFIAGNGLLILLPCAFYLYGKAAAGEMDTNFYALQVLELVAGTTNFSLMALNFRERLKLSGRLRRTG